MYVSVCVCERDRQTDNTERGTGKESQANKETPTTPPHFEHKPVYYLSKDVGLKIHVIMSHTHITYTHESHTHTHESHTYTHTGARARVIVTNGVDLVAT